MPYWFANKDMPPAMRSCNSAWSIVFLKLKVELPFLQDQHIHGDMLGRIEPMFRTSG
jgi:hypothetical protein